MSPTKNKPSYQAKLKQKQTLSNPNAGKIKSANYETNHPRKKISYQAKLKQKINSDGSKEKEITPKKQSLANKLLPLYLVICIIVGVGVIIGLNNSTKDQAKTPNDDTTTTTTPTSTPYALTGSVTTIHGETIQLPSFQGKSLIVYFTGASCIPCKAQLPYLVKYYDIYKGTGKVEIVSLDIQGQSIDALLGWENENGITWKVCQDTGATLSSKFNIYSMPTLVILDKNGNEITRYVGAQSEATIEQIFKDAVA